MPTQPTPQAQDIHEVLGLLDEIIDTCRREESRLGYFAALYRRVTAEVKGRMNKGEFYDAERMERLDTVFANRYIEAYYLYRAGEAPTRAWAYSFAAAEDPDTVVLQHLLMGMNAHINLDLGIATAAIGREHSKRHLKRDFDAINTVLGDLVDEIQEEVTHQSGLLRTLDAVGGSLDERILSFGLASARARAWRRAVALSGVPPPLHPRLIGRFDRHVEKLAARIHRPGVAFSPLAAVMRGAEQMPVGETIARLC